MEMKTNEQLIGDYYPLCFDLAESRRTRPECPKTIGMDAGELILWASGCRFTGMQTLALLIKNAFEGHVCHLNGYPMEKLAGYGTVTQDISGEETCRELAGNFFAHLPDYLVGLELAWKDAIKLNENFRSVDVQAHIYFILSYQLFRFPLSFLASFNSDKLNSVSIEKKGQLRIQYLLYSTAMKYAAESSFIEMMNEMYAEKFREIILRLSSKETVLQQLHTKLDYANDPSVRTDEELENKYFEFLVATNVTRLDERKPFLEAEMKEVRQAGGFKEVLKQQVRKLYKTIARNCSEVHNQIKIDEPFQNLSEYFISSTAVYNSVCMNLNSLMVQHSKLVLLLAKVINHRVINHWPVHFIEFTVSTDNEQASLSEADMLACKSALEQGLHLMRLMNFTDNKLMYLSDHETECIHREFLQRHLEFVEARIDCVIEEIRQVMQDKANQAH